MDEKMINTNEVIEIDLWRLFRAVLSKSWLVAAVAVACAAAAFLGTFFFITPKYQSDAVFYINNRTLSADGGTLSLSFDSVSASRGLVKTYIALLDTRETLQAVIDHAGADLTHREIRKMIEAESVDDTEVLRVVVTSTDPGEAQRLADAVAHILPERISGIVEGTSATVVDAPVTASRPSSPNYIQNTAIGFVIGLALTVAVIAVRDISAAEETGVCGKRRCKT